MKLPEIEITRANTWSTPDDQTESRPRFVTRYELELCTSGGGESFIDGLSMPLERGLFATALHRQIRRADRPLAV